MVVPNTPPAFRRLSGGPRIALRPDGRVTVTGISVVVMSGIADNEDRMAILTPLCEAIARLLSPHAEVVLHDIASDTIIGLWNGFSNRVVGDPALLTSELSEQAVAQTGVLGPYEKVAADGRRLTSVSVVLPGADQKPELVLCVNLDRSPMDDVIAALRAMVAPAAEARPQALFDGDWREQIALAVDEWCRSKMVDRRRLSRAERLEIVRVLDDADLFATRHAARHVSLALDVSRATVYSMLNEVRLSNPRTSAG